MYVATLLNILNKLIYGTAGMVIAATLFGLATLDDI